MFPSTFMLSWWQLASLSYSNLLGEKLMSRGQCWSKTLNHLWGFTHEERPYMRQKLTTKNHLRPKLLSLSMQLATGLSARNSPSMMSFHLSGRTLLLSRTWTQFCPKWLIQNHPGLLGLNCEVFFLNALRVLQHILGIR